MSRSPKLVGLYYTLLYIGGLCFLWAPYALGGCLCRSSYRFWCELYSFPLDLPQGLVIHYSVIYLYEIAWRLIREGGDSVFLVEEVFLCA